MRHAVATCLLLAALPAAARHCEIDGEQVNPDNGATTAGRTGVLVCRQDDGSPMYEHELRDGKHVGMEKSWGYDGSRTERIVNANGNSEGLVREFWPNGTKKAEGEYRDGDAVGVQRRWHANGRLASVSFVPEAGQRASARVEYDDAGALKDFSCAPESVLDEDAKLCGYGVPVTVELHSRGRVAGRRTMRGGALVRDESLDDAGHVVGRDGDVLDLDARVGLELLGDRLILVHGGAEVAQRDGIGSAHVRERHRAGRGRGALDQSAAGQGLLQGGVGHRCAPRFG